jgi:chitinase
MNGDMQKLAQRLAALVVASNMDGVDIDYEDDYSNGSPGLTGYGEQRTCGGGPAVPWLCALTSTLRTLLPRERGYLVTHAPQPPYFDIGYDAVHRMCGDDIDYYNVQFYNQGPGYYTDYATLVEAEDIPVVKGPTCTPTWNGALADIMAHGGVPASKIVVGKIIAPADGNNGWVDASTLQGIVRQALAGPAPDLAGVFGWQWGSDTSGAWIDTVLQAWG